MLRGSKNPKQPEESMSCDNYIAVLCVYLYSEVYYELSSFIMCQMHPYVIYLVIGSVRLCDYPFFFKDVFSLVFIFS